MTAIEKEIEKVIIEFAQESPNARAREVLRRIPTITSMWAANAAIAGVIQQMDRYAPKVN